MPAQSQCASDGQSSCNFSKPKQQKQMTVVRGKLFPGRKHICKQTDVTVCERNWSWIKRNYVQCRGHEQKKDFLDLFRMLQNLGLKLSLDNKTWRKKTVKKLTTSIPILMSKLVKKMPMGPFLNSWVLYQRIASSCDQVFE